VDAGKLAEAFVEIADTLVDDFDVHDLLHVLSRRCVDLLGVAEAGLLLADERGLLRVAVASSERARLMDLFQIQNDEGPCLDCYRSGEAVVGERLTDTDPRWPRFAGAAVAEGFGSVLALPLRLRGQVIGALNLFADAERPPIAESTVPIAQSMADVATIVILQDRLARNRELLAEQLQIALNSRVMIEQAKGVIAARHDVGMEEAFERLRTQARRSRRRLVDVAEEMVRGSDTGRPSPAD
jgi:GAF domain-containing protein